MVRWGGFFTRYILGILLFGLAMYIFFPHIQILINRPYSPNFWNNLMADLAISWLAYLGVFVVVILYGLLWYIDEKKHDREYKTMQNVLSILHKIANKLGVQENGLSDNEKHEH